jgi:predicted DNA-binding antitoxin AbrB/MazE fold protein
MYAIKAVYDGNSFKPEEPIPVEGKYEVVITFTKPINTTKEKILKYFGTWDNEDVKVIDEIVEERANFSLNRNGI